MGTGSLAARSPASLISRRVISRRLDHHPGSRSAVGAVADATPVVDALRRRLGAIGEDVAQIRKLHVAISLDQSRDVVAAPTAACLAFDRQRGDEEVGEVWAPLRINLSERLFCVPGLDQRRQLHVEVVNLCDERTQILLDKFTDHRFDGALLEPITRSRPVVVEMKIPGIVNGFRILCFSPIFSYKERRGLSFSSDAPFCSSKASSAFISSPEFPICEVMQVPIIASRPANPQISS
jgi:hypothetical protein